MKKISLVLVLMFAFVTTGAFAQQAATPAAAPANSPAPMAKKTKKHHHKKMAPKSDATTK
jgi:hypothetical protein